MNRQNTLLITIALLIAGCRADAETADPPATNAVAPTTVAAGSTTQPPEHILVQPGAINWQPGPPSLEQGAEAAVLEGDPSTAGFFTMRIRMPDGFQIAPHFHPKPERVTVVSGTFLLGEGDDVDPASADALEPGSYFSMPVGMRHYAIAQGETVIQLTSTGPWEIEYVNPNDDPRTR